MEFRTKKALLEYLGKDGNDNKLVDRMIVRGEVIKRNRIYVYESLEDKIMEKEKEIKNLTEKVEQLEYQLDGANRSM